MKYDEKSVLHRLDKLLNDTGIKIVYRPHPWSKNSPEIFESDFTNLIIDPQVKSHYYNKSTLEESPLFSLIWFITNLFF